MGENKKDKTKVLLKNMHLAYVNSELVFLMRKVFSIVNYVAWVKEQADKDFGFRLETKEDIQTLQERIEEHGFSTIGEWLDCVMREKLGLWPTNKTLAAESSKENLYHDMIAPWAMNELYAESEVRLRNLLRSDGNFEMTGKIQNGGDVTMVVKGEPDGISVHAVYEGRRGSDAALANKKLPRSATYEQVLLLMRETRNRLVYEYLPSKNVVYNENGFVTDKTVIETENVKELADSICGNLAHWSLDKLYPEAEDVLRRLLSMEKDGQPADFEIFGGIKKNDKVYINIKADGSQLNIRVGNKSSDAYEETCLNRDATYEEVLEQANELYDDVFSSWEEESEEDDD